MIIIPTELPDVLVIEPQVFSDARGFFMETYHARKLAEQGFTAEFVQDNHSRSQQGTLVSGEVFDVAVDLRRRSRTFGHWTGALLSADNKQQLWIPPGFAHGFYALSEVVDLIYKVTDYYTPDWDRTLLWNDPQLNIAWPLVNNQPPILSAKDAQGKLLSQADVFEW
jgi:dTDP-4-dehydrorhamnose 3,5-epimerase